MDKRIYLPEGYRLKSERQLYIIDRALSSGSNSVVYQAHYQDNLMPDHIHTVLIKELYPWEPVQRITRAGSQAAADCRQETAAPGTEADSRERMDLLVPEESASLFAYHRDSFLMGNQAHLILSEAGNDFVAGNLDSFEANGTLYTVLTNRNGQVLSEVLETNSDLGTLELAARCIRSILYALQPFHSHGMLHLDISPDNIFLLKPTVPGREAEEVLLLDFNSVYSLDGQLSNEGRYYLGKQDYMAPEVRLHDSAALGPWTDIYSVCAVFYEMISRKKLPEDLELTRLKKVVSPSLPLLQDVSPNIAEPARQILIKGLAFRTAARYQSVGEMLADLETLLRLIREERHSEEGAHTGGTAHTGRAAHAPWLFSVRGMKFWVPALVLLASALFLLAMFPSLRGGNRGAAEANAADIPLVKDDSVVLTQVNLRQPLEDNILALPLNSPAQVRATLKDYSHPKIPGEILTSYSIAPWFNGTGDSRGWQGGEFYDFFTGTKNLLHFTMPIAVQEDFPLEYVVLAFYNFNYDDSRILLDVTEYTLTDGKGSRYEMTDLIGSHILYCDAENYIWNLMTTQNQDFVKNFSDIEGGSIEVETTINRLDPLLEVTWESEEPTVASVDERGTITPVSEGDSVITVTIRDKHTGEIRKTQLLAHVGPAV